MDFKVKVNVKPQLGTILAGRGRELSEFNRLSPTARTAIETETYQRLYLGELFGSYSSWERAKVAIDGDAGKKNKKKTDEEPGLSMENEVLNNVIGMVSKDKTTVTVHETVNANRMIQIGDRFTSVPGTEVKEKKVKKPNANAAVTFHFDSKKSVLLVEVKEFSVKDPTTQERYSKSLEKALKTAGTNMEEKLTLPRLVKSFFDTLHVHNMCYISGNEALNMMRIFRNAKVAYPKFAKLTYGKQIGIMDKGFRNARSVYVGSRDIHALAKGTFEAMCEEKGLIDEVYKHDFITNRFYTYRKIAEHRRNRVNPEHQNQIWEKDSLIFVDYVYGNARIRTSLQAFDLWDLLAKGVRDVRADAF